MMPAATAARDTLALSSTPPQDPASATPRETTSTVERRRSSRIAFAARPSLAVSLTLPVAAALVALAFAAFSLKQAIVAAVLSAVLVVLAAIDIERRVIPNRIVLPAAALVLALQASLFPGRALECAAAGLIAALVVALPQLLGRSWIGMGDAKLMLLIGAGLGWGVIGAALLSFPLSLPLTVFLLARHRLAVRKATIPFGPFLAAGALVVLFVPTLIGLSSG